MKSTGKHRWLNHYVVLERLSGQPCIALAFVAAYGVSLLVCVLPIIVMEFAVGQLTGRAPVKALYNICPLFKEIKGTYLSPVAVLSAVTFFKGFFEEKLMVDYELWY
ncbi:unnamed protein product [Gongylonema pulchrum]|uniref:RSN1_7TM domain-containing protein n=1 Tax=Gongylonema pulchrum TaxID=637853 RepID=A0A183D614_9BILA|nr:unnamed protein product [Gongylonema pulchrum]